LKTTRTISLRYSLSQVTSEEDGDVPVLGLHVVEGREPLGHLRAEVAGQARLALLLGGEFLHHRADLRDALVRGHHRDDHHQHHHGHTVGDLFARQEDQRHGGDHRLHADEHEQPAIEVEHREQRHHEEDGHRERGGEAG
jgi:hypothetical protein